MSAIPMPLHEHADNWPTCCLCEHWWADHKYDFLLDGYRCTRCACKAREGANSAHDDL